MNCPLVRKCFGIVFFLFLILYIFLQYIKSELFKNKQLNKNIIEYNEKKKTFYWLRSFFFLICNNTNATFNHGRVHDNI